MSLPPLLDESNPYLPLIIDFTDKVVVIFGGGAVGERKVKRFAKKSFVTVVSTDLTPDLQQMEKEDSILFIEKDLSKLTDSEIFDCMSDAFLVIAATSDSKVNRKIVSMAKTAGVLVNDTEKSDEVIIPSLIERGGLQIAISSSGESPAVTKYARMKIEEALDENLEQMILLQSEMREYLKTILPDQKERQEILWKIMNDDEIWSLLPADFEKAREKAMSTAMNFVYSKARRFSKNHRIALSKDSVCGCYYCLQIFSPKEITEWIPESDPDLEVTALCPFCGIDAVIGESSGYPITAEFLQSASYPAFGKSGKS